jgi:hypothetical protein
VCDDVHNGAGGSEVGVFLVSVMLMVVVGVTRFAVDLVLLEMFKVVLELVRLVLVCWWGLLRRWCVGGSGGANDDVDDGFVHVAVVVLAAAVVVVRSVCHQHHKYECGYTLTA